jgi:DNA-binding NarL/FixJ family response regulator
MARLNSYPTTPPRLLSISHLATGISLTPREIEVVAFMREGFTNAEIGRLLGISTHTAKAHVAGVIEKLGASDRTQAVARAFDLGLLSARTPGAPAR